MTDAEDEERGPGEAPRRAAADAQLGQIIPTIVVGGAQPRSRTRLSLPSVVAAPAIAAIEPRWPREATRLPVVARESYEPLGYVASGGIGRVRKARHEHLDRPVALKELHLGADPAQEERFVREALITARLQHPSIVPIYEAGRWPSGEPFYAMKLVSGRSLADVIVAAPSYAARLALLPHVLAVAEAVAYAHSLRIIHRDLKPDNVLVGEFGETVVIDWGLAKDLAVRGEPDGPRSAPSALRYAVGTRGAHDFGEHVTQAGAVMGTPAYMPPEQAFGEVVDERADVYAIGAILYHVLAGRPPYRGSTPVHILRRVQREPYNPLPRGEIAHDLATIVDKAMARRPRGRYPTARDLADDLRRFQTGQIVGAHRYSPLDRLRRLALRFRAPLAVAAVALGCLAALSAVSVRRIVAARDEAERGQAEAEEARRRAVRHADDLALLHARVESARDPNHAIALLNGLSPSFSRWPAARVVAADAAAHGLSTVLGEHAGAVDAVTFSPDGATLATAGDDHLVMLWDLRTGRGRGLTGHTDEVYRLAYAPDGAHLASAGKDGTVRVWDTTTLEARVLEGHSAPIRALAYAPDGRRLASGSADGAVRLWEADGSGARIFSSSEAVRALAFSPDGSLIAAGGFDGSLRLHHLATGRTRVCAGPDAPVVALAFSPDGATVFTRDLGGALRRWDMASGAGRDLSVRTDVKDRSTVAPGDLRLSPAGALLASVGEDDRLRLWSAGSPAPRVLEGHQGRILSAAFSPDGAVIATASYDRTVRLWDTASGVSRALLGFDDAVISVAFSPDGGRLAAGAADGSVRVFQRTRGADQVLAPARPAIEADLAPAGKALVSAGRDGAVLLWDVATGARVELARHGAGLTFARFFAGGSIVISGGADGAVRACDGAGRVLWSAPGGSGVAALARSSEGDLVAWAGSDGRVHLADARAGGDRELGAFDAAVNALAFSPDGRAVAGAGLDRTARIWSLDSGSARVLRGHEGAVLALAFSPDGRLLLTGSEDHTLRFWDVATSAVRVVDAGGSGVTRIAFSHDGATVITASRVESSLRLWDPATGRQRGVLRGHDGEVRSFAISPDGSVLATASADRTVRLWDLASGEARVLRGHAGAVRGVSFSPDGRRLASVGEDGTVRVWSDELPREPAELRAWIAAASSSSAGLRELTR